MPNPAFYKNSEQIWTYKDGVRVNTKYVPVSHYRLSYNGNDIAIFGQNNMFTLFAVAGCFVDVTTIEKDETGLNFYADIVEFIHLTNEFFRNSVAFQDDKGNLINTSNPLSIKIENIVVEADVNETNSNLYNFTGDVLDLFRDNTNFIIDNTANNPKQLDIYFETVIISIAIGLLASSGDFSNTQIFGITGNGAAELIDESLINTKYNARQFEYSGTGYIGLRFLFHTADPVTISRCVVTRAQTVVAQTLGVLLQADEYFSEFITNLGNENMAVNGSVTPVDFEYLVQPNEKISLRRCFIELTDGNIEFQAADFGAIANGLTNGVVIDIVKSDGVVINFETWYQNKDISLTAYDFTNPYRDGSYIGRWTFQLDVGDFITILPGDRFRVRIQDNLSLLDSFTIRLKGKRGVF